MARGKPRNLGLLLKFSGINGLIGLGAGFIIPLIPTWLFLKFAMTDAFSGPLLAVSSLVMGVAAFGSPVLAKRWGPIVAIVTTQAASIFFMLSLAFVPDPFLAGALYTVRAALMNMGIPILDSYLMSIITPEERGFASALNSIIWRLPNSVSTVVGGVLLAAGEFQLPFFLATGLYSVAIVLFYAVFRNVTPQPPTSAFPAAH
jgi:predicted MFS family arabinose efflux permease